MQSKSNSLKILIPLLAILAIAAGVFAWSTYGGKPTKKKTSETAAQAKTLEINSSVYSSIAGSQSFDAEISTDEAGFGRDNPFAPYK